MKREHAHMAKLTVLIPGDGARGAGIVTRYDGRLLFLLERTERPTGELVCIRVGGNCREEESFADCARREAREETGCEVALRHSEQTFAADERGDVAAHALDDALAPLLVYTKQRPDVTPPSYHNALFAASLEAAPRPGPEAETLLLLPDEPLLALAERPRPLSALVAAGAQVESIRPPSPEAIVLPEVAPRHLAALLRRSVRIE
jgi:ADP-ribose pyrophosphatase YjhB (NUDIX family)